MRILVAAGGTGGHIYPALAVLRPLTQRRPDLEVRWLGGRRGLESAMVPARGLPVRPALAADPAHGRPLPRDRHGPGPARRLRAPGDGVPRPMAPGRRVHHGRLRRHPGADRGRGAAGAVAAVGGEPAGRAQRAGHGAPRERHRGHLPGHRGHLSDHALVTGTPIRELVPSDRAAARERLHLPPDLPVLLVFGGSQAVLRFNRAVAEALPSLVDPGCRSSMSRASQGSPRPRRAGTGCRPSCVAAIDRIRSCARTWPTRSWQRTCWSGGPAPRRSPRRPPSACP